MEILDDTIIFKTQERYIQIQIDKILYCQSDGSYTNFFLEDFGHSKICGSLKQIENHLLEFGFLRIHNSCLVNVHKVSSFCSKHYSVRIQDRNLPISRNKRREVIIVMLKSKIPDIKNPHQS